METVKQFFESPTPEKFSAIWALNPEMAMKSLFYILDERKLENEFLEIFCGIVYKQQRKTFDRNLSLLAGIYNDKLLSEKQIQKMAKKDWETNESYLQEFVSPDYQDTFRQEFYERVRKTYFDKVYKIPIYGSVKLLEKIKEKFPKDKVLEFKINKLIRDFPKEVPNKYKTFEKQFQWISAEL